MDDKGTTHVSETSFDNTTEDNPDKYIVEHDVEKYAVGDTDPSASSEETKVRGPQTEEEMRECKYCEFKAKDWPVRSATE